MGRVDLLGRVDPDVFQEHPGARAAGKGDAAVQLTTCKLTVWWAAALVRAVRRERRITWPPETA